MRACCKGIEPVSLKKTLQSVSKKVHFSFESDVSARSATTDPAKVRPGDVFFAVTDLAPPASKLGSDEKFGETVELAIRRGCSAVVADRPIEGADSVPFFIVPNVSECFATFCHTIYDCPAKSLKMIGITGTSGKTTTSYLISGMLAEAGFQVGLIGSLGIFDGQELHPAVESSLTSLQLAYWLHRMTVNGCTHVIVEASSKMIVEGTLAGIKFDAICITNIRRDHIDYHSSVERYRRSKLEIFKYAKKKALAICNIDDRITEAIVPLIDHPLLLIGMKNQSEVGAVLVERYPAEQTFIVTAGSEAVPFCTKIIGDEHIYNSMMAAALGIGFEIDIKTIARGIERVENVPGRMERIECGQPFNVFIDSARTTDSLAASLRTVREVTKGKLICVFGAAEYHESAKRGLFAKTLETLADMVVLTSSTDRLDAASATAICDIGKCFTNAEGAQIMPDRAEAIAWALSIASENDTVLIFGPGVTEPVECEAEVCLFSDRHFAKQWLYENHIVVEAV